MNLQVVLSRRKTLKILNVFLVIGWIGVIGCVATLGTSAVLAKRKHAENLERARSVRSEIAEAKVAVQKARDLQLPDLARGLRNVRVFQDLLQRTARRWGCELLEFKSSAQSLPFSSRFTKDAVSTDWVQVDIQASIRGNSQGLLTTLSELASTSVPHEYNVIELRRVGRDPSGRMVVALVMEMRIVVPPDGGA